VGQNPAMRSAPRSNPGLGLRPLQPGGGEAAVLQRSTPFGLTQTDIDESLRDLDTAPAPAGERDRLANRPRRLVRRLLKWVAIIAVLALIGMGIWVGWKALMAGGSIFKGNVLGLIQSTPLKEDSEGRTNVLVLGTSEDDPGHAAAYLTDSMMVVSVNQKQKTAAMFSIPRDMYVKYGMACNSGYQGKINEYFSCVNDDMDSESAEEERLVRTREFVGEIFGMDIQYAVHINNTVIKEAVDAVGGIDVDIQGSGGAPGILDRNFDWRCKYKCHYVKYDNGVHHLDGEHALFLAMARGDVAPTYGLGNSNFDREKNQQKIILALKEKAMSTGSLTNVAKVSGMIEALGNNLRTNFATNEIRTLMRLGTEIESKNIQRISLRDEETPMVTTGNYGGASAVVPVAGPFEYDDIRDYIDQQLSADPATREGAKMGVFNGSGLPGAAQTEADKLTDDGFTVAQIGNASGEYRTVEIYQRTTEGMDATKAKLESIYGVKVKTGTPPVTANGEIDFIIIIAKSNSSE
jgi:LCP family protein required for cell wall assembly